MVNFHTSSCIDQSRDGDSQGFAPAWPLPFSFISLWKVDILLVDLVHLVSFVQPKNQTNQIDQMNKTGWRDFSAACYSGTRINIQGGLSSTMSANRLAVLLAGIPGKMAPRRI
jgi:hypothetical protein